MMTIGLVGINIYVRALNYACPLHVYAFQEFLREHGYDVFVIDYLPNTNKFEGGYDARHPSEYFNQKVLTLKKELEQLSADTNIEKITQIQKKIQINTRLRDQYLAIYHEREDRYDKQWKFIDKFLRLTKDKYDCALMEIEDPGFDCYICPTDILWDKFQAMGYEPGFFLSCTCMENKWKIAYAASKLVVKSEEDIHNTTDWIRNIDFVSVREKFLQKHIQETIRTDVACVLDPVLLHEAAFYEKVLVAPLEENYLLIYYVVESRPDIILAAVDYAKKHNMKIIELSDRLEQSDITKNSGIDVEFKYGVGIQEWIGYFRYAKMVFTNSFHGTCLCLLFHRNFYSSRRSNYDKITALLSEVHLEDRIIDCESYEKSSQVICHWNKVDEHLDKRRKESEYFIFNALTVAEQQEHPYKDYLIKKKEQQFKMFYNVGKQTKSIDKNVLPEYQQMKDSLFVRTKSVEFFEGKVKNDGSSLLHGNIFRIEGYTFIGWYLRVHIDYHMFYLLEDGKFQERQDFCKQPKGKRKLFHEGERIPVFPLNRIQLCVAEAVWK